MGHAVEKIKKGQLLKPLAPNSSSVDDVDNPPRDPVCHTSDLEHAVEKIKKGQLLKPLAPNSSSVDGVDNPPRDPVRHTTVLRHAPEGATLI